MIKHLHLKFILFSLLALPMLQSSAQTTTVTVSHYTGKGISGHFEGPISNGAMFNSPSGVAVDVSGNIYVADAANNLIRKITPAGMVSTFAGSGSVGSSDGTGTSASFNNPTGVAFDGSGNLYVADAGNNLIRKITSAGVVSTFAGSGSSGSTDATGTAASFNNPSGVALDASGNVYVADAGNHKIRKVTAAGVVSTLAGSGTAGNTNATGTAASFNGPSGVAVDGSGNVYVVDQNNCNIRKITSAGVVTTLAGIGSAGFNDGTGTSAGFYLPSGVALDGSGNLYVTDQSVNKIRKITPSAVVTTFAGTGYSGSADGTGTSASFNNPSGVVVDGSGNVFVSDRDNNRIRKITSAGVVTTYAGTGSQGSADGYAIMASFRNLTGIAIDASGNMYLADDQNYKIRKVTAAGIVSTLAGNGTAGSADGVGTAAGFNRPYDVAVDGSGNVYVADMNNHKIRKITPAGVVTTLAGSGAAGSADGMGTAASFNYPNGVAVDGSGNVYVSDQYNQKIRKITPAGVVTTLAGSGAEGSTDATGTSASFNYPVKLAVDGSGNVYVADYSNHKIRKITPAGVVTTLAGSGTAGSTDATGTSASFKYPVGVAIDGSGNVFVVDFFNEKIRKITPAGVVTTLAGTGACSYLDGDGTVATFCNPYGIALDAAGNAFVTEGSRIRKLTITTTTGVYSGQEYSILPLYPNPTQGELHIDVDGTKNIRIVDVMGRVVMEQEINGNQLSVVHLPKGIYAVIVEQMGKKYVSRLAKE